MYESEIQRFLSARNFAVAGASPDRSKYGNKVLRALLQRQKQVVAIHPLATDVEGVRAFKSLSDLPEAVESLSIITPPSVTEKIVADAIGSGVRSIWMQPGAESDAAIELARASGIDVIAGGPCLLVAVGFRE